MKKQHVLFGAIAIMISFSSCKKKGCTDPAASNYNSNAIVDDGSCQTVAGGTASQPGSYTPTFTGEFGALIAIKTISTVTNPIIGTYDVELGTAVAVFRSAGSTDNVSAGNVAVNSNTLTAQTNGSYVFTPGAQDPTGIDFSGSASWTGSGSTWNSFTANTNQGFAVVPQITSTDINTTAAYTLSTTSITNADSILFAVYGPSGTKQVIVAGTNTSHTFSASDMSTMGTGSGYIQIVGLNYDPQIISSKNYYLINETVRTKQVSFN